MNLFNTIYDIYNKMYRDFPHMIADANNRPVNSQQIEQFHYGFSMADDGEAPDRVTNFIGGVIADAIGTACHESGKPNVVKMSANNRTEPGVLKVWVDKDGLPEGTKLEVPARLAKKELEAMEGLLFSDWKETGVENQRTRYMVKTFATPAERGKAIHFMRMMGDIYGLDMQWHPTDTGDAERNQRTMLIPKDFFIKLVNYEKTLEFSEVRR